MLKLLIKAIVELVLAIWSIPLLVGIAIVWSVAVIPRLVYSIMAGTVRLVGVNSVMYTLPEFIDACARPLE